MFEDQFFLIFLIFITIFLKIVVIFKLEMSITPKLRDESEKYLTGIIC